MGEKRGMKALELWCKRVTDGYPGVKVENMTTSWRDGLAFCALIHHFRPDLIDFSSLKKSNIYGNNELAFRTAERHLGIPALLDAEDMVEYEVPDRLSILTYLSQFYQTFASHPSSPVKRSPDSPDHSLVLSPSVSTPPSKEGRRREPCLVCGLPVFLAQRLIVGGHLYHRTCFRCARCSAQLTMANCYETQDGAYCCETCPDEEIVPQDIGDKGGGPTKPLYIEHEHDPGLAEESTAEDKTDPLVTSRTASLVGMRRMMFENIAHTDQIKSQRLEKVSGADIRECEQSSDVFNEQPNKINLGNNRSISLSKFSSNRLSNVKAEESDSSLEKTTPDCEKDFVRKCDNDLSVDDLSASYSNFSPASTSCVGSENVKLESCNTVPAITESHCSDNEDFNLVTEIDDKTKFNSLTHISQLPLAEAENLNISVQSNLDVDSDLEQNSFSSDLSIAQAKNNALGETIEYCELVESKESVNEKLVETKNDALLKDQPNENQQSLDDEKECVPNNSKINTIKGRNNDDVPEKESVSCAEEESSSLKEESFTKDEDEFTSLTQNIEQLVIEAKNEEVTHQSTEKKVEPALDCSSIKENIELEEHDLVTPAVRHKPPTPQRRKQKVPVEPKIKKPDFDYPEELNPFGDDDEEEEEEVKKSVIERQSLSTNPFGSSDEEDEDVKSDKKENTQVPTPALRKVIPAPKNLNPFWSDGEEEDEAEISIPVPKPRKVRTPQPTPEPSPQPQHRLRPSTGSLGSVSSLASRKKKPAPLPPNMQTLTPGSRKSYSAPQPPAATVSPSPPPLPLSSPPSSHPSSPLLSENEDKLYFISHERKNSTVSETSSVGTISSYTMHKSTYGQWKRKKGPAPPRPVPVRRHVEPMPLASIRQELADIEIKQQGLERQGVKLEQTIRDKFEQEGASLTPHVEEMVLQLFELVNEKNELFRRQAELMYLRRQHNLEEEHAELEYQIRYLMLCPERNKTDSDKAREEQLIQRLVEVVERRNEIIDCLESDRIREREEDRSVGTQLGIFSAEVGSEVDLRSKSEKKSKKLKKEKRAGKRDVDKDVEEVSDKKRNKKKWFTLHRSAGKS